MTDIHNLSEEDLRAYAGPNADHYVELHKKLKEKRWVWNWCWGSFLFWPAWFCYRRLYLWTGLLFGAFILLAVVSDILDIATPSMTGLYVGLAISVKPAYINRAAKAAYKADINRLKGEERARFLREQGGVSPTAGWIAGVFTGIPILIAIIFIVVALAQH